VATGPRDERVSITRAVSGDVHAARAVGTARRVGDAGPASRESSVSAFREGALAVRLPVSLCKTDSRASVHLDGRSASFRSGHPRSAGPFHGGKTEIYLSSDYGAVGIAVNSSKK